MLTKNQQELYDSFYESTHNTKFLNQRSEVLVGLASAVALNCKPCTVYYLKQAKKAQLSKGEISEVIAKVMAVAAGQKKLQTQRAMREFNIDLDNFQA